MSFHFLPPPFSTFSDPFFSFAESFSSFVPGWRIVADEQTLRARIAQLQTYRSKGISTILDAERYESQLELRNSGIADVKVARGGSGSGASSALARSALEPVGGVGAAAGKRTSVGPEEGHLTAAVRNQYTAATGSRKPRTSPPLLPSCSKPCQSLFRTSRLMNARPLLYYDSCTPQSRLGRIAAPALAERADPVLDASYPAQALPDDQGDAHSGVRS